ncbi:MAG TPA: hypothetical protein VFH51_03345, partial [Myxococcota bacterium]|nr:hypothetical protein [Myxococcota bacterium]
MCDTTAKNGAFRVFIFFLAALRRTATLNIAWHATSPCEGEAATMSTPSAPSVRQQIVGLIHKLNGQEQSSQHGFCLIDGLLTA